MCLRWCLLHSGEWAVSEELGLARAERRAGRDVKLRVCAGGGVGAWGRLCWLGCP
jgi:hypothetical protein